MEIKFGYKRYTSKRYRSPGLESNEIFVNFSGCQPWLKNVDSSSNIGLTGLSEKAGPCPKGALQRSGIKFNAYPF